MENKDKPTIDFDGRAIDGTLWQVAWALGESKVTNSCSLKAMYAGLNSERLWGQKAETSQYCIVYIRTTLFSYVDETLRQLRLIKERGPYRHKLHPLPAKYKKYKQYPLRSTSEEVLAKVLFENGILDDSKISTLHAIIENEGRLFARFEDGAFVLYFSEKAFASTLHKGPLPEEKVKETDEKVKAVFDKVEAARSSP